MNAQEYQQQLSEKEERLKEILSDFELPELEVFESPVSHFRLRAEFRIWHDGDDMYYVMFNPNSRDQYRVDQFPIASSLINELMPLILEQIKDNFILRRKLFQVDFLTTLSGEVLVTLIYHRQLDNEWTEHARELRKWFNDQGFYFNLVGRARKLKIVLNQDYVLEQLNVHGRTLIYKQVENSFTQPNGKVAEKMLEWAVDCTRNSSEDLLELYCGNGNFSLALAQNFRQVLATEHSKSAVKAAQYNIIANKIDNVSIVRLSAEELTQAIEEDRPFRRLRWAGVDLKSLNCTTVLVDPPRAGLDQATCTMVQKYKRILYISCNPQTLRSNLEQLAKTHKVVRFALFDQFPYTQHIETGVVLEQRI